LANILLQPIYSVESAGRWLKALDVSAQKLGLERIERLMLALGNPHHELKCIHLAGTNGKGSCSAMLTSILQAAGYQVGTFTSPHLVDPKERLKVQGEMLSETDWANGLASIQKLLLTLNWPLEEWPTYFECLTALAFMVFFEKQVDWVVLEVGLGGRLDSTNCILSPAVSVITSIGMDHQEHLGDTLGKIATEKAGILKPGAPVVLGPNLPEVARSAIFAVANQQKIPDAHIFETVTDRILSHWVENPTPWQDGQAVMDTVQGKSYTLALNGAYQQDNLGTVLTTLDVLRQRESLIFDDEAVQEGLKRVVWPARLQWIADKNWIIDGSHNPDGFQALSETLNKWCRETDFLSRPVYWLVSLRKNRDPDCLFSVLAACPNTAGVFFTQSDQKWVSQKTGEGLYHPPDYLKSVYLQSTQADLDIQAGPLNQGLAWLKANTNVKQTGSIPIGIITGSLYTAGDVLKTIGFKSIGYDRQVLHLCDPVTPTHSR
jgi:dihydrofolate synthase/folylpolyglutamate synthase